MTLNIEGQNTIPLRVPLDINLYNKSKDSYFSLLDDPELVKCFLTVPDEACYLNLSNTIAAESEMIREKQLEDEELKN